VTTRQSGTKPTERIMHTRTLLLNALYIPIRVIPWEAAVKLRYEGTVDVVAEYTDEIRSPSVTWRMPAVVRLKRMPKQRKRGVKFSRVNVYLRDKFCCQYCGKRCAFSELTYDHVVPRSSGGRTEWRNIVAACGPCNLRKGNRSCDNAGMWPRTEPVEPRSLPQATPRIDTANAPEEWLAFVTDM